MDDKTIVERLDKLEKRLDDYWAGLQLISSNLPPYRELLDVVRQVLIEAHMGNGVKRITMERLQDAFSRVPPSERG